MSLSALTDVIIGLDPIISIKNRSLQMSKPSSSKLHRQANAARNTAKTTHKNARGGYISIVIL
jgi:hypothetical protein